MPNYEFDNSWIKRIRKERGMTLKNVSEKTGLSISYLSDIERGRTEPSLKTLIKIMDIVDIHVESLFDSRRGFSLDTGKE